MPTICPSQGMDFFQKALNQPVNFFHQIGHDIECGAPIMAAIGTGERQLRICLRIYLSHPLGNGLGHR